MLPAESVASGWMLPATEHLRGADGEADQHVDAKRTGDGADGTVCAQQQVGALGDPGRICCGQRLSSQARDPIVGARQKRAAPERRARRRYGNAVREALIAVWEASDRVCSTKRPSSSKTTIGWKP